MNVIKISLEYGDKSYDVEVVELTQAQKNSIAEKLDTERAKVTNFRAVEAEFKASVDTYDTNVEILSLDEDLTLKEKVKLLWEQKKLLSDIKTMRPKVEELAMVPVDFEQVFKEKFEMMIDGDGKASLMKAIEEDGASYQKILDTIFKTVEQEKEKKSSSS